MDSYQQQERDRDYAHATLFLLLSYLTQKSQYRLKYILRTVERYIPILHDL